MEISSYANNSRQPLLLDPDRIIGAHSALDPAIVLSGQRLFTEFSGSLTENYVGQQLIVSGHDGLYFWASSGEAEADFLVQTPSDSSSGIYRSTHDPLRKIRKI